MVQIKTTRAKKQHCIVMLATIAERQKLPPYVSLRQKMAKEKFPRGIIVQFQKNGWMTEDLLEEWIKSVRFQLDALLW
jgi:hypothetical protein